MMFALLDDCPAAWAEFEGKKGVFIEGQVSPPLSGVQVVISSGGEKPIADIAVETDNNGKYRFVSVFVHCLFLHESGYRKCRLCAFGLYNFIREAG